MCQPASLCSSVTDCFLKFGLPTQRLLHSFTREMWQKAGKVHHKIKTTADHVGMAARSLLGKISHRIFQVFQTPSSLTAFSLTLKNSIINVAHFPKSSVSHWNPNLQHILSWICSPWLLTQEKH